MIAERYRQQRRLKAWMEGWKEGWKEGWLEGRRQLAKRLLNMSDAERKSEIERIVNGDG